MGDSERKLTLQIRTLSIRRQRASRATRAAVELRVIAVNLLEFDAVKAVPTTTEQLSDAVVAQMAELLKRFKEI